ncbi:MAG: MFS transporter [bacterium]|nr:MFS transporter [bacterium]
MYNKKNIILWILILIALIMYFVANFQRIAVPGTIFDILVRELNVNAPYITALGSVFMYIYAFSQLIVGVLVDRYGGIRVMSVGSILLVSGCILFPIATNLVIMYVARGLIGVGAGTFYLSIIKELKNLFSDKNYGIAISIMLFIGYAGGIFAGMPFVLLMKTMTWKEILLGIGIILAILLFIFVIFTAKYKLPPINKSVKLRTLPFRLVLHKRHNRNLFSFACCNFGLSYVIQTIIGKKFLEDFCNITATRAAFILSMMAIVAASFNIINASLCKICHNKRVRFLKIASVITASIMLTVCILIFFDIKSSLIGILFCILAGNASLTSLLVPVLYLTNKKMVSTTAVSIMNFCFFMMVGILGTLTGFILNIFEPTNINGTLIYSNNSYLLLFGIFFAISLFEMYKARRLSNKY